MQCGNTNFTINKGIQNEFIFTIKQNDGLLPMIIDPLDAFSFKIYDINTDTLTAEVNNTASNTNGEIEIYDAPNGQIKVILTSALTSTLKKERGGKEDRYYLKPSYRISIDGTTINNGKINPKIPLVYVE